MTEVIQNFKEDVKDDLMGIPTEEEYSSSSTESGGDPISSPVGNIPQASPTV